MRCSSCRRFPRSSGKNRQSLVICRTAGKLDVQIRTQPRWVGAGMCETANHAPIRRCHVSEDKRARGACAAFGCPNAHRPCCRALVRPGNTSLSSVNCCVPRCIENSVRRDLERGGFLPALPKIRPSFAERWTRRRLSLHSLVGKFTEPCT
jgi:hypothetical protein